MQVLTPCVQDGHDADIGSEVLGIGSNDGEGFGRSLEQQAIDDGLVLVGDPAERRRQLEHQVKIRHGKELGFARRKPCRCRLRLALSAVPVATRNGELTITCLMGKIRNGELAGVDVARIIDCRFLGISFLSSLHKFEVVPSCWIWPPRASHKERDPDVGDIFFGGEDP